MEAVRQIHALLTRLVRDHPLAAALIVATILRLVAVLFSKGYMYTDDHYETVSVAYRWLQIGPLSADGYLIWGRTAPSDIARCPIYVLFLYGIMKLHLLAGIDSLDQIMYGIRFVHGAVSLLSVYAGFRIVELTTNSRKWALLGGMIIAAHFAIPTLSVRTLIEFFNGHFWLMALLLLYLHEDRGESNRSPRLPFWAGVLSGVAWMIRFQIVFAVIVTPLLLLWQYRRLKEGLWFAVGAVLVVAVAGIVDWFLLGEFLGGTLNHIRQALTEDTPAVYEPIWVYVAVILAFFIPPLSAIVFSLAGLKRFWMRHRVLVFSTLAFVFFHNILGNRQERFMMPIVPALCVIATLVIWQQFRDQGLLFRWPRAFYVLVVFSLVINLLLLPAFTLNYGRKGMVEPLVRIERLHHRAGVIFVSPEQWRLYPFDYGGFSGMKRYFLEDWSELEQFRQDKQLAEELDYYILYPRTESSLPRFVDSLEQHVGPLKQVFHVGPSTIDYILHVLNPRHNPTHEAWVYSPAET